MFHDQIDKWNTIVADAKSASDDIQSVLKAPGGNVDSEGQSWLDVPPISPPGCTPRDVMLMVKQAVRAIRHLKLKTSALAPVETLTKLAESAAQMRVAGKRFAKASILLGDAETPRSLNGDWQIQTGGGEVVSDFRAHMQAAVVYAGVTMEACAILEILNAKNLDEESDLIEPLHDFANEAAEAAKEARAQSRAAAQALSETQERVAAFDEKLRSLDAENQTRAGDVEAMRQRAEEIQAQLAGLQEESAKASGAIQSRLDEMVRAQAQAQAIADDLNGFASTLDRATKNVKRLEDQAGAIVGEFKANEDQISRMLGEAEKMLSSSTVAGLAAAFKMEKERLERGMVWASIFFGFGIFMVIGMTWFFAQYVLNLQVVGAAIPGLPAPKVAPHDVTLPGLLARTVLLIGPIWFTQFSASRYRQLFELRQQYAHKYNMAYSADGFRKAAGEKYDEDITLWIFNTISKNPVTLAGRRGRAIDDPPTAMFGDPSAGGSFIAKLLGGILPGKADLKP